MPVRNQRLSGATSSIIYRQPFEADPAQLLPHVDRERSVRKNRPEYEQNCITRRQQPGHAPTVKAHRGPTKREKGCDSKRWKDLMTQGIKF